MQKRGGGRFGKYGDLKRKDRIRRTRTLKHGPSPKDGLKGGPGWARDRYQGQKTK